MSPDPNLLKKLKALTPEELQTPAKSLEGKTDMSGLETGIGLSQTGAIPERYKSVSKGWSPFNLPKDLESEAAKNQTTGQVLSNMFSGFAKQAGAGFVKALASWDLEGIGNMAIGNTEKQYGNWLDHVADGILKRSQEEDPIFQAKGEPMTSPRYWANQVQGAGLTFGIIAEALVEQVGASFVLPGEGNAVALGNKARLLASLGKQFTHGSMKGVSEAYTNATDTQAQTYQKYVDLGYSEDVAKTKSAEAASLAFRAEVLPLMMLNGLQFGLTFGAGTKLTSAFGAGQRQGLNQGFSGAAETLVDKILPNIKNKYVKGGVGMALNTGSEALEEVAQTGISNFAQSTTLKGTGDAESAPDLLEGGLDAGVAGAVGGLLLGGIGKAMAPLIKSTNAKRIDHVYNSFLNAAPTRAAEIFANKSKTEAAYMLALDEANANPSKENEANLAHAAATYKAAQTDAHLASTLNALHLDSITGKTTAFESHIEQMQNISDAVKAGDMAKLKEYNLVDADGKEKFAGSFDYIKANFEENIKKSHEAKDLLDKNLTYLTSDYESAWDITKQELKNKINTEDIAKSQAILDNFYANDVQFRQLSPEGQQRFKLNTELEALTSLGGKVNQQRAKDIAAQLATDEDGYSTEDAKIVGTISKFIYEKGYSAIGATRELINMGNEALVDLKDKQKIKQKIENRTKTQIAQTTSKEQLAEVAKEAAKAGAINDTIAQQLAEQRANIVAQQEAQILAEQTQNPPVETPPAQNPANIRAQSLVVGNSSLFGEGIVDDVTVFEPIEEVTGDPEAVKASRVTAMLAPSAVDPAKVEEKKAGLKAAVGKMIGQLKPEATFEDLVRNFAMAKNSSMELAEKNFYGLVEGWKLNNKPDENFDEIFNNIFSDPVADFLALDIYTDSPQQKAEQAQEQAETATNNEVTETKILEVEAGKPTVSPKGTLVYNYDGKVTASNFPTLAVMFRLSETSTSLNQDGTVSVSHEYVEQGLLEGTEVDSRPLLNPDAFTEGTTLRVSIPSNFNGIIVPIFNGDGTKTGSLPFGVWANQQATEKGISLSEFEKTQEYKDKIPMIVHREGAPVGEKGVAFIHDIGWYSPINFAYDQQASMQSAIAKTKATRDAVLKDVTKPVSITVTRKRTTNFNAFKTPVIGKLPNGKPLYQFIPYAQANPEAKFVVGGSGNKLKNEEDIFDNGEENVINRKEEAKITEGYTYELRRAGIDSQGFPY